MSQRAENVNNLERLPRVPAFAVRVGETFITKKKRGDSALKISDDGNANWCLCLHVSQY